MAYNVIPPSNNIQGDTMLNCSIGYQIPVTGKIGKYTFSKYPGFDYDATIQANGNVILQFMFHVLKFSKLEFDGMLRLGMLTRKYA